jgi:hypothetical protein
MRTSLLVATIACLANSAPTAGQTQPAGAATAKTAQAFFTPPRTPWGDPDISGNVTNVFEASTPFERPESLAGRRLEDIHGEKLVEFRSVPCLISKVRSTGLIIGGRTSTISGKVARPGL